MVLGFVSLLGTPAWATLDSMIRDYDELEKYSLKVKNTSRFAAQFNRKIETDQLQHAISLMAPLLRQLEIPLKDISFPYLELTALINQYEESVMPFCQRLDECRTWIDAAVKTYQSYNSKFWSGSFVMASSQRSSLNENLVRDLQSIQKNLDLILAGLEKELKDQRVLLVSYADKHPEEITDLIQWRLRELNRGEVEEFKKEGGNLISELALLRAEVEACKARATTQKSECAALEALLQEKRNLATEVERKHVQAIQWADQELASIQEAIDRTEGQERVRLEALRQQFFADEQQKYPGDQIDVIATLDLDKNGSAKGWTRDLLKNHESQTVLTGILTKQVEEALSQLLVRHKLSFNARFGVSRTHLTLTATVKLMSLNNEDSKFTLSSLLHDTNGTAGILKLILGNFSSFKKYSKLPLNPPLMVHFDASRALTHDLSFTSEQERIIFSFLDVISGQEIESDEIRHAVQQSMREHLASSVSQSGSGLYPSLNQGNQANQDSDDRPSAAYEPSSSNNVNDPFLSLEVPLLQRGPERGTRMQEPSYSRPASVSYFGTEPSDSKTFQHH